MYMLKVLLKKEFGERISSLKNKSKDIMGNIFNVILLLTVVGVFVAVFMYLAKTYTQVKIGYVSNIDQRIFEVCTIFYFVLTLLLFAMGVVKLNKNLISAGNASLMHLPITPFQIFISKLIIVYIELVLTSCLMSVAVATLFVIQGFAAWWSILVAFALSLLLPIITLAVASVFTIPYYFVKSWLGKHFIIQLCVYVAIVVCAFLLYSQFLKILQDLMESGRIAFVFNEAFVNDIKAFCASVYPVNIFSSLFMSRDVLLNLLFLILSVVASAAITYYLGKLVFQLVRQNKIGFKNFYSKSKYSNKQKSVMGSLIGREMVNVLRTPSYAFNYYAIVISLPLMVVVTTNLLFSMMKNLIMFNCDFEIVLCVVCMYSILLNSFCANNISRDGKFFNMMKTYPVSPMKIVMSKIIFCSITSFVAIIFTAAVILINGQLSILKTLAVVVICITLNIGIICIATRKDLNTIKNIQGNENSSSTNFLVFWGLLFAIALTVLSFVLSIFLQFKYNLLISNIVTCSILLIISVTVLILSIWYLFRKLNKKFKEVITWDIKL